MHRARPKPFKCDGGKQRRVNNLKKKLKKRYPWLQFEDMKNEIERQRERGNERECGYCIVQTFFFFFFGGGGT